MNSSRRQDSFNAAFTKNLISVSLLVAINFINGSFVYIFFKSQEFKRDPRYVLYIHLVVNDMIMLTVSVLLQILTYTVPLTLSSCCTLLFIASTTNKISPLNLAGMAVERYVAVCRPLHHAQLCTVRRTYALIALVWGVSSLPGLSDIVLLVTTAVQPLAAFSSSRPIICYANGVYRTQQHKALAMTVQVLLFSSVFLTLIITYLKVLLAARAACAADQSSARKAQGTILLHGVQLLICMVSYMSPLIIFALVAARPDQRTVVIYTSFLLTNVLPRLLSPLIYGVRDKKFNGRLRLFFTCRHGQRHFLKS